MITDRATKALAFWALEGSQLDLIAQRENTVFRVTGRGHPDYALRLHRPGYQALNAIGSELAWMGQLASKGIRVPAPVLATTGALLVDVDGHSADLLTWLDGRQMGATGQPLVLDDRLGTFREIGALMAQVHVISDDWTLPDGFERHRWDVDGLLGEAPLWGRFWDNPGLCGHDRHKVLTARDRLRDVLAEGATDFGLIHADMLRENLMIGPDGLGLIDFDDSGFGYRLFDVATTLFKNRAEPDFDALQAAFLHGYRGVRPLDTALLTDFMLLRALSYLGWIIPRMDEPGSERRQARFLADALPMVDAYLGGQAG